jgi:hypothetical protein
MESDDLKSSPPPDDAALETWLRANAALPPLADDGFAQRVLVTLPPARRRSRRGLIAVVALGAGVMALGAGIILVKHEPSALLAFNTDLVDAVNQLLTPAGSGAVALTLASLWYAFRDRWHPAWSKRF